MARHRTLSLIAAIALAIAFVAPAHATPPETADALFAHARAEAKAEHKNVLMVFSASWCGPCNAEAPDVTAFAEAHAADTVVVSVDVGEPAQRVEPGPQP